MLTGFPSAIYPEVVELAYMVAFLRNLHSTYWLHQFISTPTVPKCCSFSVFLSAFVVNCFLGESHSDWREMDCLLFLNSGETNDQ